MKYLAYKEMQIKFSLALLYKAFIKQDKKQVYVDTSFKKCFIFC